VALDGLAQCLVGSQELFVAWASLEQQKQNQEKTEQPPHATSPFAKDLTKFIEAARVEEECFSG
jgi:hypothetical protein